MQMSVRGRRAESSIVSCDVIKEERQVEEWSKVEVEAREANGLPGFRVFLFVSVGEPRVSEYDQPASHNDIRRLVTIIISLFTFSGSSHRSLTKFLTLYSRRHRASLALPWCGI